jgi:DNA-binding NarL/FixJ family response regulator
MEGMSAPNRPVEMNVMQNTAVPPGRKRVMLVDDHEIVRKGVRALVETRHEWVLCAEVADGLTALKVAKETQPDLVVLDISMPGVSGLDLILQLKNQLPKVEILVLTMHESERMMAQALRAGARGYLLKTECGDNVIEALSALSRHQAYFSAAVSEALLKSYVRSNVPEDFEQLTPRERQIVKLVAEGYSNKKIAMILNIGVKTVETHRATAMRKTGTSSSADLTLYAARNDLVQV